MTSTLLPKPLLIGHRGASGYRPEHTASAYLLAFAQGVDAVEPDLVVSRDGVIVIRHENEISGTTDVADRVEFADRRTTKVVDGVALTGWFTEDFTWDELATLRCRERVPELRPDNVAYNDTERMLRLSDLIGMVDEWNASNEKPVGLVIELKHVDFLRQQGHDLVGLMQADLEASGWNQKPELLTIECFEIDPLDRLREAGALAQLIFLMESKGSPPDQLSMYGDAAHEYAWYRTDAGLDSLMGRVHGISLSKRDLMQVNSLGQAVGVQDIVERAHSRGLLVFTWTLRPENGFLVPGFRSNAQRAERGGWRDEWKLILSTGLDGVFLDHPDLLAEVLS